ncbi:uncharacterized protein LOC135499932 [Lineus longissimus]|uniref:uncharacterized protein LOC135499932 n=1 Tax=Lineus longissimus TaxID=88925 RepID=UPI00315CD804
MAAEKDKIEKRQKFLEKCELLDTGVVRSLYDECLKLGIRSAFRSIKSLLSSQVTGAYSLLNTTDEEEIIETIPYVAWQFKKEKTDVDVLMLVSGVLTRSFEYEIDPLVMLETLKAAPNHMNNYANYTRVADADKGKDINLYVGNNSLKRDDLNTLKPEACLNDQVTHAYLDILSKEVNTEKPTVHVLPSFLAVMWEKNDTSSWLYKQVQIKYMYQTALCIRHPQHVSDTPKIMWHFEFFILIQSLPFFVYFQIPLSKFKWVLLPICTNEHWVLLVADMVNHSVGVLDSLDLPDRRFELYLTSWRLFMIARGDDTEWTVAKYMCSKQDDNTSCGVFVMMNAESLLKGVPPFVMRQWHCDGYRRYALGKLLSHAKTNDEIICDMPFCNKPSGEDIAWLQCDYCNRWFHNECVALAETPAVYKCLICMVY